MTLLMRDRENVQKGKIYGMISAYKELNISEDIILKKLRDKFQLSEEEAKEYMQEKQEVI